jgi:hypothetical protein
VRGATNSVVFLGEAALYQRFLEVLAEALKAIDLFHLYKEWQSVERDPLYLAAYDAAKLEGLARKYIWLLGKLLLSPG